MHTPSALLFGLLLGLLPLAAAAPPPPGRDEAELLRQGLFEEEVNRDLGKAASAYAGVIEQSDLHRAFAATALFRLAEIRVRQGNKAEGTTLYRRLLADFPNQDPLARLSRERLAALGASLPAAAAAPEDASAVAMLPAAPTTKEEADELAQMRGLVKDSPDLLNAVAGSGSPQAGYTPLILAAEKGWSRVAAFLLDHGARANGPGEGGEPLHAAAAGGHKSVVKLLLAHGADVNAATPDGWTALHAACYYRRPEIIQLLLDKNAKVDAVFAQQVDRATEGGAVTAIKFISPGWGPGTSTGFAAATPLLIAINARDQALAALLLDHRADPNLCEVEHVTTSTPNNSPLLAALFGGQQAMAELLLQRGARADYVNNRGSSALHAAARSTPALVASLLERGLPQSADQAGRTPLASSIMDNGSRLYLSEGPNAPGYVPLAEFGKRFAVYRAAWESLLAHGANIDPRDGEGKTPLHYSTPDVSHPREVAAWLLAHGADINAGDKWGNTPLHVFCKQHSGDDLLKNPARADLAWLIEHGADTDRKNSDGKRPFESIGSSALFPLEREFRFPQLIPGLTRQRAVHSFLSLKPWRPIDVEPVTPVSDFDAPPTLVSLTQRSLSPLAVANLVIRVHRAEPPDGQVREVAHLTLHFGSEPADTSKWPTLRWGDVVVFESDDAIASEEAARGFRTAVEAQSSQVTVQLGDRTTALALADPTFGRNSSNGYTWLPTMMPLPGWTLAGLVQHLTAGESRAMLESVRLERTLDGQTQAWTLDLRTADPGAAVPGSGSEPSPVKKLPGHLAAGDRLIIPLRPAGDAASLEGRRGAIFLAAPGRFFTEKVFARTRNELGTHTLGELLMQAYLDPMLIPAPDLSHLVIHRLEGDGGEEEDLPVDLARSARSLISAAPEEVRRADMALQWGDVVEISVLPDATPEQWTGFDVATQDFLRTALGRKVPFTISRRGDQDSLVANLAPEFFKYTYQARAREFRATTNTGGRTDGGVEVFSAKTLLQGRVDAGSLAAFTIHLGEKTREYDSAQLEAVDPWLPIGCTVEMRRFSP